MQDDPLVCNAPYLMEVMHQRQGAAPAGIVPNCQQACTICWGKEHATTKGISGAASIPYLQQLRDCIAQCLGVLLSYHHWEPQCISTPYLRRRMESSCLNTSHN
jgi:hypothetical protein